MSTKYFVDYFWSSANKLDGILFRWREERKWTAGQTDCRRVTAGCDLFQVLESFFFFLVVRCNDHGPNQPICLNEAAFGYCRIKIR
jgi:hypothetical protein